jgi:hypothetical protein
MVRMMGLELTELLHRSLMVTTPRCKYENHSSTVPLTIEYENLETLSK